MSEIEHAAANVREIGREILRKGIILGIDWNNHTQVVQLAHQTLAYRSGAHKANFGNGERRNGRGWNGEERVMEELVGLTTMMIQTIVHAGELSLLDQGGEAWQVFLRALTNIQESSQGML